MSGYAAGVSTDPFLESASIEGVPSAFAATRDGIDSLIRDRGLRRTRPEITVESLLLGAAATAALEGSDFTVDELRAGGGDDIARAAVRLSSELLGLVPVWNRAPLQAIARIHSVLAAGLIDVDQVGRPVNVEGASRLSLLSRLVQQPTKAPGLVVAALVHAEIASAGAFVSLNGVVARAAERVVMVAKGVDPASVTVPEAGHAAEPDGYRAALDAYARGDGAGVNQWLMYASQAFVRGADVAPLNIG